MDGSRFDTLTRAFASGTSRRSVLRSAGFALFAALVPDRPGGAQQRTEVCHKGQRIAIANAAVAAHVAHGDDYPVAPIGSVCIEVTTSGGGFFCAPPDGLSTCDVECVGTGTAGDGRCANSFVGCVPDGVFCTGITPCCSGVCDTPATGLSNRCGGGCVGPDVAGCLDGVPPEESGCCAGLVCVSSGPTGNSTCRQPV